MEVYYSRGIAITLPYQKKNEAGCDIDGAEKEDTVAGK